VERVPVADNSKLENALADLEKRLAETEKAVKSKAEKDYVQKEIALLRELISKLGSGGQVVMSPVSDDRINELSESVAALQALLDDLRKELN
jgi:uncharacterized coiled-coil protein SlyX